ncbi:hypothetical protein ACFL0H_00010 [Thermodesulfobacteriota bacterium]
MMLFIPRQREGCGVMNAQTAQAGQITPSLAGDLWVGMEATNASRSGVPIEIVSKVILRHSNLSTTERYLGKVSDVEAMKWIQAFVWSVGTRR